MKYATRHRGPATAAIIATVALILLVAVALVGTAIINRRLLPRAAEAASTRFAEASGGTLSIGDLRYRPFAGVVAADLHAVAPIPSQSPDAARRVGALSVDAVRLPLNLPTLRRLRRAAFGDAPPEDGPWSAAALLPDLVEIDGLRLSLSSEEEAAELLAFDGVRVEHSEEEGAVSILAGPDDDEAPGPAVDLDVELSYQRRRGQITIAGIDLATDGPIRGGIIGSELAFENPGPGLFEIAGRIDALGLELFASVLAAEVVGPMDIGYRFAVDVAEDITFTEGTLSIDEVEIDARPSLRPREGRSFGSALASGPTAVLAAIERVDVALSLRRTPLQTIADAVPEAVLGSLEGIRLAGTLDWTMDVSIPTAAVGDLEWTAKTEVADLAVDAIPAGANPFVLTGPFIHRIVDREVDFQRVIRVPAGTETDMAWMLEHTEHSRRQILRRRERESRPAPVPTIVRLSETGREPPLPAAVPSSFALPAPDPTYRFVRLQDMSPWVVRAVLTTEDGDFFFHDGVNFLTLVDAIERNLREGEVVLGASTLTMQLSKMLFLDQERTIARKLQEVFLVYLMESVVPVPKERILELYVNIAELGPGVFGIAAAASHYFGKDPSNLTAGEATFLASILPSPKRYHAYYEAGAISDGWFIRMKSYYDIMLERGRMTEEEHAEASAAPPAFASAEAAQPTEPAAATAEPAATDE